MPLRFLPWNSKIGFWSLIFRCKIYLWSFTIFIVIYLRISYNIFWRSWETLRLLPKTSNVALMLHHPAVEQVDWSQFTIEITNKYFRTGLRQDLFYRDCYYFIINSQVLTQLLNNNKRHEYILLRSDLIKG